MESDLNKKKIFLSIITVNKNNAKGLELTIQSVIEQSFNDFEYIIIDGGSDDESINIIKKYEDKITYWISETDHGIYNAMNKGIKKAIGTYCLFLNSGDYLYNNEVLKDFFSINSSGDIIYGEQLIEKNGIIIKTTAPEPEHITFSVFLNYSLPHQCTFIKRNLFDIIGMYNEKNKIISDWEWISIALFRFNCSLRKIPIPVTVYNTNGISNNNDLLEEHLREKRRALERNFPRIIPDYDEYTRVLKRYQKIPRIIAAIFNKIKKG